MEQVGRKKESEPMDLAPGFRFHPTDEELITHYLSKKVLDPSFDPVAIGEADLNKCEPWNLPWRAKMGEKERYFFCVRDRKYPTGLRTNRATESGYWKATGKDKDIYRGKSLVGMKKTLVFYKGRAPKGEKSDWVMHEYRLEGNCSVYNLSKNTISKNDWVISRVFKKRGLGKKEGMIGLQGRNMGDEFGGGNYNHNNHPLLPPLMDSDDKNMALASHVTCFSNAAGAEEAGDEKGLAPPNLMPDHYFNITNSASMFPTSAYSNNSNMCMLPPQTPTLNLSYNHMNSSSGQSLLQLLLQSQGNVYGGMNGGSSSSNNISLSQSQSLSHEESANDHISSEISSIISNQNRKMHSLDSHSAAASLWNY